VCFGAGLPAPLQGAAAGCGCRALYCQRADCRNLGAVTGYSCQSAVCAMKLGCWCGCRGGWAVMEITFMP